MNQHNSKGTKDEFSQFRGQNISFLAYFWPSTDSKDYDKSQKGKNAHWITSFHRIWPYIINADVSAQDFLDQGQNRLILAYFWPNFGLEDYCTPMNRLKHMLTYQFSSNVLIIAIKNESAQCKRHGGWIFTIWANYCLLENTKYRKQVKMHIGMLALIIYDLR